MANQANSTNPNKNKTQIELLATAYHALCDWMNAYSDSDEEIEQVNGIANSISDLITPLQPTCSKDWAHKLSIDSLEYMVGAPVMDALVKDVKAELAA